MKRRVGYLGLWLVATAFSIAMAWLGLRSVLVAAAPGRLDLLDQLNASANPAGTSEDEIALGPATSVPGFGGTGNPVVPTSGRGVPGPGGPTGGPDPGPAGPTGTTQPSGQLPTGAGPPPSKRPVENTTTTPRPTSTASDPSTLGTAGDGQSRTIQTRGGDSTLRFSEDNVTVVSARPVAGHSTKIERVSPTSVIVTFSSPNSVSRIQAAWSGGPAWRITEMRSGDAAY